MNPAEQRARHTVLAAVTGRQDDLETVLRALASELVDLRAALEALDTARREQGARALEAIEELAATMRDRLGRLGEANDQAIRASLARHREDTDQTIRAELASYRKAAAAGDLARAATTDALAAWRRLPWRDRLRWIVGRG